MATTRAEFQDLAADLIDQEFAEFRRALSFTVTTAGAYDPITETTTGGTTTAYRYQAIPQPVNLEEWQGQDIQVTDIGAVYTRTGAFVPSISDTCTFDGRAMQVRAVTLDAAGATVKLVLRAL